MKGEIREMDGIGYRENGEIRMNPPHRFVQDLNSLPHPARDLLDLDRYRMKRRPIHHVDYEQGLSASVRLLFRSSRHGKRLPNKIAGGHR